jgi:hypothetical protein
MTIKRKGIGRKPASKPKTKAPPEPKTPEEIVAAVGKVLEGVEAVLDKKRAADRPGRSNVVQWNYPYHNDDLYEHRQRITDLAGKLLEVLIPPDTTEDIWDAKETARRAAEKLLIETFTLKPGEPRKVAYPSQFIAWAGTIPVRCMWGGFAYPRLAMGPLDPTSLWIAADDIELDHVRQIDVRQTDPAPVFREALRRLLNPQPFSYKDKPKRPKLYQMPPKLAETARAFIEDPANAWWVEQIALGPVDAVELPHSLLPVQRTFVLA